MPRLRNELLGYMAASSLSLSLDVAVLLLLKDHMHYLLAGCISFLIGSVTHYFIAIRLVFRSRRLADRAATEGVIYFAIGCCALLFNIALLYAGVEWLDAPLLAAKIVASSASFALGFAVRKLVLFHPNPSAS